MSFPPGNAAFSRVIAGVVVVGLVVGAGAANALDKSLGGHALTIERSASGREKMVLVLRDATLPFPAIGGPDDPSGQGLHVELFAANDPSRAVFGVPPGLGELGWTVIPGTIDRYRFENRQAPEGPSEVRVVRMKESGMLKVVARRTGLALAGPQGAVGVRVVIGDLRICALFDASTVRRDEAGRFIARRASAANLSDCTTVSLGGVVECGDGFVDDPQEICDGFGTGRCQILGIPLACQPPGAPNACGGCCGGRCPEIVGCCGPSIRDLVLQGHPCGGSVCISTSCVPPWTCGSDARCIDGACCADVGSLCISPFSGNPLLPCCPGTICQDLQCCVVDGGDCSSDADCCSHACGSGGTCEPA